MERIPDHGPAEFPVHDSYPQDGKGVPETGVLASAALKCMGGQMWGQLLFRNDDERGRAEKAGITDFDRVYTRDDMVTSDAIFAATGTRIRQLPVSQYDLTFSVNEAEEVI